MGDDVRPFDFAGYFKRHYGPLWRSATYTRVDPASRAAGKASSGTNPTSTPYPCTARTEPVDKNEVAGERTRTTDRKVLILGATLDEGRLAPRAGDRIEVAEKRGVVKLVLFGEVSASQHEAIWTCYGRA